MANQEQKKVKDEPHGQAATNVYQTDFLVIGSGIAGLTFALNASSHGRVIVITKKQNYESNTNYAQGGIAAVMAKDDNYDLHIQDTLEAGAGLCDRRAVEVLVKEGPARVHELLEWGVNFRVPGKIRMSCPWAVRAVIRAGG